MDNFLFLSINSLAGRNAFLDAFMIFNAEILIYILIVFTCCLIFRAHIKKKYQTMKLFAADVTISFVIYILLQWFFSSKRPFVLLQTKQLVHFIITNSFPSGHTTIAFALGIGVLIHINRRWGIFLLCLAFLIGFSRIFVGVHYPLDILAGVCVAFAPHGIRYFLKMS